MLVRYESRGLSWAGEGSEEPERSEGHSVTIDMFHRHLHGMEQLQYCVFLAE